MRTVTFPGLGLEFELDRVAFQVFGIPIYWYGVIIAAGFLLAVVVGSRLAPRFGFKSDDYVDFLFFGVPLGILGARLYYILFYLELFRSEYGGLSLGKMLDIRQGGLAIYGGVIVGVLVLVVFCRVRKLKTAAFADLAMCSLLVGQIAGRWGNFVNVEAYGGPTELPWRMGIDGYVESAGVWEYMEVHPTFLYESLWNLAGLILLLVLLLRGLRRFDGQFFFTYLLWYGFGRGLIEGLRADSLYFFGTGLRVSQLVGFGSAAVGLAALVWNLVLRPHRPEELYVNRGKEAADHGGEDH